MSTKNNVLKGIIFITLSFGLGWVCGYKRIPPSAKLVNLMRGSTNNYNDFSNKPRYELFELSIPNPAVVFLGDSITEASIFNETFETSSRIYNRGVGGDTAVDILNRLQEIKKLKPRFVYLMVGINDLHKGASPEQVAENIVKIHDTLAKEGIKTIVQKTIQCQPSKCSYTKEVNELNKTLASIFKSELIDLGELNSANGLDDNLTYDGVHLNKKGYEIWIKKLQQSLSSSLQ